MADYDFDMINPVEGLQNVTRLNPARRREERRRQRQFDEHKGQHEDSENDDSQEKLDISDKEEGVSSEEPTGNDKNQGSKGSGIDFCA